MSVFHRIGDVTELDGPTFLRLAWRLPAYRGVLRERVMAERTEEEPPARADNWAGYAPAGGRDVNPGTKAALQADPAFQGIFSFG